MDSVAFATIIVRGIAVQFILMGTLIAATLAVARVISMLVPTAEQNLDNHYYVVTEMGSAVVAVTALVMCFIFGAILFFASATVARWLSSGLQ